MRISPFLAPPALVAALLAAPALVAPGAAHAGIAVGISIGIAPPALPVYEQPLIPAPGYLWTPGYWAWGDEGYYWVPGTWVMPPSVGLLWTPGYWGWSNGAYAWNGGYWGSHIGFYGGVNYGFGYGGVGYEGGFWDHGDFRYNSAVTNVNTTIIHNTYNKTVINNNTSRAAFNGGEGGTQARATDDERRAAAEHHVEPTHEQLDHEQTASRDPNQRASENHGKPAVASTAKPGEFKGPGVVAAKEAGGKLSPEQEHPHVTPAAAHEGVATPHPTSTGHGEAAAHVGGEGTTHPAAAGTTHPAGGTAHTATAGHSPAGHATETAHPATSGGGHPTQATAHPAAAHPATQAAHPAAAHPAAAASHPAAAHPAAAEHPAAAAHPAAAPSHPEGGEQKKNEGH